MDYRGPLETARMVDIDKFGKQEFLNYYRCPQCGFKWEDVWTATCDDDCSNCGCRHISPYKSEDFEGEEQ